MRAHIVKDGIVVDTIEVESLDFMEGLIDGTEGGIGWRLVNGQLLPPEPSGQSVEEFNAAILSALDAIDKKTPRAVREALLFGDTSRVEALETEASALRSRLIK